MLRRWTHGEKPLITLMQPSAAQLVAVAPVGRDLLRSRFGAAKKYLLVVGKKELGFLGSSKAAATCESRRLEAKARPQGVRVQFTTEGSESDGREPQARVGSTYLLRLCDWSQRRRRVCVVCGFYE